jgi:orotidine-5'-phosphate decarboxylase
VDQLLVALDVEDGRRALALADSLRGVAGGFKIGSRLFTAEGPAIVRALAERGDRIFLDLKFHDIPNTVAGAVEAATTLGVWMVNVHAAGGAAMMRAARDGAGRAAAAARRDPPLLIAVTVLTSMTQATLDEVGVLLPPIDQVTKLASLTQEAGLDGVVASPLEIGPIRRRCGDGFVIVTPGIRPAFATASARQEQVTKTGGDDQARTMGPAEAIRAGASFIVVGRPIIAAPDPRAAAEAIVQGLGTRD